MEKIPVTKNDGNNIIIYGCGYAGKVLTNYFLLCENKNVTAIMVSPGHKEADIYKTVDFNGNITEIPIIELGTEKYETTNTSIFLTLVIGKEEVFNKLKQKGYELIYDAQPINFYEEQFFSYYLKTKNIDTTKEIINFGNVKMYNPIIHDPELKKTFYETIGDELLPGIFNDYALVVDGAYEYRDVFLKEGDYVIDAGANIGSYSCYAAEKGCTVYACEPGSKSLDILEKQKTLYEQKINIIPLGLSDNSGYVDFYESDDCALDSIYMPRGNTRKRQIKIETIDNLVANGTIKHVDYIKADIEGAERYMLKGATNTLLQFAPKLSICTYHYKEDPVLLEQIIKEANPNYIVEHHWRKLYAYVPK